MLLPGLLWLLASWGCSSLWCLGFLLWWILSLWSTGSRAHSRSSCGLRVAPQHVESSKTRVQTRVPCIGRQILNHCATEKVLLNMSYCQILSTMGTHVPGFTVLAVTQEYSRTWRGPLTPPGVLHQQRLGLVRTPCGRPTLAALFLLQKPASEAQPLPLWLQCSSFHFPRAGPGEPQEARNESAAPHTLHFSFQVLNVSFAFELMQDGGLEKPKPRPEGTLLFPGFMARGKTFPCTQVFMAQSMIRV